MSTEKITLIMHAVGDAPPLKQKKFSAIGTRDIAWLTSTLRNTLLKLPDDKSLFLYINQTFAPSPDHTLEMLAKSYAVQCSKELVIHYSTTPAWG